MGNVVRVSPDDRYVYAVLDDGALSILSAEDGSKVGGYDPMTSFGFDGWTDVVDFYQVRRLDPRIIIFEFICCFVSDVSSSFHYFWDLIPAPKNICSL